MIVFVGALLCCCADALLGDVDLLGSLDTCEVFGEDACEPCCEGWRGFTVVGAFGRTGVATETRGEEIPEGVCFGYKPGTATMPA